MSCCCSHTTVLHFVAVTVLVTSYNAVAQGAAAAQSGDDVTDQLQRLQAEEQKTKQALTTVIKYLIEREDEVVFPDSVHVINKRQADSSEDDVDYDDLLSQLPISGFRGSPGRDGRDGTPGRDGINGRDGVPGPAGATGAPGNPGRDGRDGVPGTPGASPPSTRTSRALTTSYSSGTVYTRWGRTTCGNNSSVVYKGFAGSSSFDHKGGGVNFQCLPTTPEYNTFSGNPRNWKGSRMSGAEYQSFTYGIFPDSTFNQNVPCARCYTETRSAVMMLPAKRTCPNGWTREYEGYLMAANKDNPHPTTYECMDSSPEHVVNSQANTNGALFLFVKPDCEGLGTVAHCPPYDPNRELTCVVCTK